VLWAAGAGLGGQPRAAGAAGHRSRLQRQRTMEKGLAPPAGNPGPRYAGGRRRLAGL